MPKQILLYGPIDSYSACEFNEALTEMEVSEDEELVLRINTQVNHRSMDGALFLCLKTCQM